MRAMTLFRRGELVDGVQKTAGVGCREGQQRGTIRSCKGTLKKSEHGLLAEKKKEKKRKEKKEIAALTISNS